MSVLEDFLILFSSDADEVEQGAKKAKKSSDDLNKSLNSTSQISERLGGAFNKFIKQAAGYVTGLLTIGAVISSVRSTAKFVDQLGELSDAIDVNITQLALWGDAVQLSGGSTDSFQNSIKTLSASLSTFAAKGSSLIAPFFQELGIRMVDAEGKARDVFDILPEIASAFEKLGKQESFGIGQKLGLDQGTIMLLQRGRLSVDELITKLKEFGEVTNEDKEIAAKFHDEFDFAVMAMRSLFVSLNRTILPILSNIAEGFRKTALTFKKHSGLMEGVFIALSTLAGIFAIKMVIAAFPIYLITALILALAAAFVIAYDDVKAFLNGQDSLLGQAIKKWPILGNVIKFIGDVIKSTWSVLKDFWTNLEAIGDVTIKQWQGIINLIKMAVNGIIAAVDKIKNAYNKVKEFLGLDKNSEQVVSIARKSLITANSFPGVGSNISSSRFNNRSTSIQTGPITIETKATDAQGISQALGQSLNTQLRQTVNTFDDGVLA